MNQSSAVLRFFLLCLTTTSAATHKDKIIVRRHDAITSGIPRIDFRIDKEDRNLEEDGVKSDIPNNIGFTINYNDDDDKGDVCAVGCEGDFSNVTDTLNALWDAEEKEYELFFTVRGRHAVAAGVIFDNFEERVRDLHQNFPGVDTLVLVEVPGSANDDASLAGSTLVHELGYSTCVPSNGMVASGGTDLFVAGVKRFASPGARIGIHSWSGSGDVVGSDFPQDHPSHVPYLEYYDTIGIPKDFYWQTLSHGQPMYYIRDEEIAETFPYLRNCDDVEEPSDSSSSSTYSATLMNTFVLAILCLY